MAVTAGNPLPADFTPSGRHAPDEDEHCSRNDAFHALTAEGGTGAPTTAASSPDLLQVRRRGPRRRRPRSSRCGGAGPEEAAPGETGATARAMTGATTASPRTGTPTTDRGTGTTGATATDTTWTSNWRAARAGSRTSRGGPPPTASP